MPKARMEVIPQCSFEHGLIWPFFHISRRLRLHWLYSFWYCTLKDPEPFQFQQPSKGTKQPFKFQRRHTCDQIFCLCDLFFGSCGTNLEGSCRTFFKAVDLSLVSALATSFLIAELDIFLALLHEAPFSISILRGFVHHDVSICFMMKM